MISKQSSTATTTATLLTLFLGIAVVFTKRNNHAANKLDNKKEDDLLLPKAPDGSKFVTLKLNENKITVRYVDTLITNSNDTSSSNSGKNQDDTITYVFIHGFMGVAETWQFITPHLLLHNKTPTRILSLDLIGQGFSDYPNVKQFDYTFRGQGKIVSKFIQELQLNNVVIVGHSSGTIVAASAALDLLQLHQQRTTITTTNNNKDQPNVIGLVFVSTGLFLPKPYWVSIPWLKPFLKMILPKAFDVSNFKGKLERSHLKQNHSVLTNELVEQFSRPTQLPKYEYALIEMAAAKENPFEMIYDDLLKIMSLPNSSMSVPTLFIRGDQDFLTPDYEEEMKYIEMKTKLFFQEEDHGGVVLTKVLKDCGHYPQHEQSEKLAKELIAFVEDEVVPLK